LSASRYREVEHEEAFLEKPAVTLKRLAALEAHAGKQVAELQRLLSQA
jgi:hypothetical protein